MAKRALVFAILVVLMDSIGFGLLIPVLPTLLAELGSTDVSGAAGISLWMSASYALMQFIFGPMLGVLSDRFGRKPVLIVSVATLGIDYIVLAMAPSLWILFVGRLVAGVAGATFSTAFAVAADVSSLQDKGANIGLVSAGFGIGFVLGPVLGGLIGEYTGPRGPIWAAAVISGLNLIFGLLFFKESLPSRSRTAIDFSRANPLSALFALRYAGPALIFVGAYFLYSLASNVYQLIWPFYGKAQFSWDEGMIGLSLGAVGVGFFVTQGFVLRTVLKRYGPERVLFGSTIFGLVALAALSVVQSSVLVFVFAPVMALGAMTTPTLNTLISSRVGKTQQGAIQGLLSSMMGLSLLLSPFIYNSTFQWFTRADAAFYWPGAPFAIAAVLASLVLFPAWKALRSAN